MRITLCALALAVTISMHGEEPTWKIGATIFADYTYQETTSSFNVSRAYVNVTGALNQRIVFRVTPDIAREISGGSQQFRLKYAYAQLNLDEWTTKGSFARFGMQQTPYLDAAEQVYRYRFQGTGFAEREGYLSSSDTGLSLRYVFPANYGDVHGGFYNGEGYTRPESNGQKAFQLRATVRPFRKDLRATLFVVDDRYDESKRRERLIGQVTYEHVRGNAGVELLSTRDGELQGRGWSAFATPRLGRGWELLLRHDHNRPDRDSSLVRKRNITGVAYWLPNLQKMTAAVMVDRDALSVTGRDDETRYGVKMVLVF